MNSDEGENAIRIATPDDFQELFRISCLLHAENGMHPFSEEKSKRVIWAGCNRDNAIIGVIGPSHDIKAMIYLQIQPIYYSDEYQLGELFNFCREDCRRSDFAKRMIRFAKRCATECGLDLVIGVMSDHRLAAKARLYDREFKGNRGVFYIFTPTKGDNADAGKTEGSSELLSA